MSWQTASLFCAFGFALKGFAIKASCRSGAGEMGLMAWVTGCSAVSFWVLWFSLGRPSASDFRVFLPVLAVCVAGAIFANVFYFRAMRLSPLSVVMPILSLSPAFMILTSRWMLGEIADPAGIAGIISIAAGTAILYIGRDPAAPADMDFRRGFLWALATSFIWSITSNLDKRAVILSDPFFYAAAIQSALSVIFFAAVPALRPGEMLSVVRTRAGCLWLALATAADVLVLASQMSAILQTNVAYVIAIKRSGAILAVILGWMWLGEGQVLRRLFACGLMVAGVALLILTHS